jgi:hypothetical protein
MKADTIAGLLRLALDAGASNAEARTSLGRILAAARKGDAEALSWLTGRKVNTENGVSQAAYDAALIRAEEADRQKAHAERVLVAIQRDLKRWEDKYAELERKHKAPKRAPKRAPKPKAPPRSSGRGAPDGGRVIVVRYGGKCADGDCGKDIAKGERARWWGRGRLYCLTHDGEAA